MKNQSTLKTKTCLQFNYLCIYVPNKSLDEFGLSLKEVRVRFAGFGAEEDEWVNVKNAVRERSVPLEHSECHKVQVGDLVCCFQVILTECNPANSIYIWQLHLKL